MAPVRFGRPPREHEVEHSATQVSGLVAPGELVVATHRQPQPRVVVVEDIAARAVWEGGEGLESDRIDAGESRSTATVVCAETAEEARER